MVVAGYYDRDGNDDFAVIRYNSNGTLDTGFDADGIVTTAIDSSGDLGYSVAIQEDGKIVVAGNSNNGSNIDFAVVRYNSDGTLDTGFDTDGKVTTAIGSSNDAAHSIAIQADGKIVVAGNSNNGSNIDFAVVRYNSNGTLDTGFGSDGIVTTAIGLANDEGYSTAIQADGKIVVAGFTYNGSNNDIAVVRYNSDGTLDTDFDTDGKVTTAVGSSYDNGYSVKLQSDGKIVVAGTSYIGSNYDFAIVRYNDDGTLDTNFDTDGMVTTAIGSSHDNGYSLAIQADGKMVVAGTSYIGLGYDFSVVRYNSDGTLDTGFSTDGKITTAVGSSLDYGYSVALQSDGKIVVAGNSNNGSNADFAVIRYTGSSGPLPVELTSFTAALINNQVMLNWATASEVNNYGFDVERQVGNRQNAAGNQSQNQWEKIGFVKGNGNSSSVKTYSYVDHMPFDGKQYYRLKQIDSDGQFEYSKIVEISFMKPVKFALEQNYPNPFNPSTTISFSLPKEERVKLVAYNLLGQVVKTIVDEVKQTGINTVEFNSEGLSSGVYLYSIESGGLVQTKKLTVLK